ncbi:hypothetical protein [Acidiphilium sp. JA12-A1]|uniref:hypothetical protein n=1 Tax=Acidiphilium sp. JA12-A1 TaxID=1464546 RepID=UPI00128EE9D7|nr:hypothetical protein [Acidiphilium sp. JA12-A1]
MTRSKIIVSDSSVLMDLAKARLIEATLALPFEFVIPDVILTEELLDLRSYTAADLPRLGFRIGELEGQDTYEAFTYYRTYRANLSLNDCFALRVAEIRSGILMTGDAWLRKVAADRGIEVHGLLWVADHIAQHGTYPAPQLAAALETLGQDPLVRLPTGPLRELIERLRRRK